MSVRIDQSRTAALLRQLSANLRQTETLDVDAAVDATLVGLGVSPEHRSEFEGTVRRLIDAQPDKALASTLERRAAYLEARAALRLTDSAVRDHIEQLEGVMNFGVQLGDSVANMPIFYGADHNDDVWRSIDVSGVIDKIAFHAQTPEVQKTLDLLDSPELAGATHVGWLSVEHERDQRMFDDRWTDFGPATPSRDQPTVEEDPKWFAFLARLMTGPAEQSADPVIEEAAQALVELHDAIAGQPKMRTADLVAYGRALTTLLERPPLDRADFAQLKRALAEPGARESGAFARLLHAFATDKEADRA